ncbi:MAG: hypothetical protein AAF502_12345 [Bacteroidota bacterium]
MSLSHGDQSKFSKKNKPLSPEMALDFLYQEGDETYDEFTEFIPCFRLPDTKKFHAVVYWQGDMLKYYFHLAIFDITGEIQEKTQLAGTKVEGDMLDVIVANIKSSWEIELLSGKVSVQETNLSKATLLPTSEVSIDQSSGKVTIKPKK